MYRIGQGSLSLCRTTGSPGGGDAKQFAGHVGRCAPSMLGVDRPSWVDQKDA